MPPKRKKKCLPSPDVLSNLPDSVIDDILMRLPFRDVVRTSILSKKWRYNWRRLPQVKFDQTLWKTTEDLISPTSGFTIIVYHLWAVHTGPITKFTLNIPDLRTCPNIDHLIYFLSRNGIQHLVLKLPLGKRYKLPSSFFISSGLRHLTLARCLIRPPPVFKGFDRLISLELRRIRISSESLGSLISHCPFLESLVVKNLDHDYSNPLEINAPKLRSFVFCGDVHCIHLKNVPLLSNVSLKPTEFFELEAGHDLVKIIECIPALENFCWDYCSVQAVHTWPPTVMPARLSSALNCLKRLYLSGITLGEYFELSFVLCLIRSSPNLEEIEITGCGDPDVDFHYEPVPEDVVDEIPASFSDMNFNHLRRVMFYDVTGADAEMQLIKVLLANSPALVRMVIKPCEMEDKESFEVLAEITKFQRASAKAEVYPVD